MHFAPQEAPSTLRVTASWIDFLSQVLARAPAFRGHALRPGRLQDEPFLFALHREAMRDYVSATWGWDDKWQRMHFAEHYAPSRHAIILRDGAHPPEVGRLSLTRHWRKIFLRDIELVAAERNHGVGSALIEAVLELAHAEERHVELLVLKCNPARRLYSRLGFRAIEDDGSRLKMRAF